MWVAAGQDEVKEKERKQFFSVGFLSLLSGSSDVTFPTQPWLALLAVMDGNLWNHKSKPSFLLSVVSLRYFVTAMKTWTRPLEFPVHPMPLNSPSFIFLPLASKIPPRLGLVSHVCNSSSCLGRGTEAGALWVCSQPQATQWIWGQLELHNGTSF